MEFWEVAEAADVEIEVDDDADVNADVEVEDDSEGKVVRSAKVFTLASILSKSF